MDRWASGLCQRTVNPPPSGNVGSNPTLSTKSKRPSNGAGPLMIMFCLGLAQSGRVLGPEPSCRRFKSYSLDKALLRGRSLARLALV